MAAWTAEDVQRHNAKIGAKMPAHVPARKSKLGNVKTLRAGTVFDSKREADRYSELVLLQKAGEIFDLELQPLFDLCVNGVFVCRYKGDFRYRERGKSMPTVEDAKGFKTPDYILKKKLMLAVHGIAIRET